MSKNTITLTESELNHLIESCVYEIIEENRFTDMIKNSRIGSAVGSAIKGAINAYNASDIDYKSKTGGYDDLSPRDYNHIETTAMMRGENVKRHALDEVRRIYELYKQYQAEANHLQNAYKRIMKNKGVIVVKDENGKPKKDSNGNIIFDFKVKQEPTYIPKTDKSYKSNYVERSRQQPGQVSLRA